LVKMMTSIRMTVYFGDHITDTAKCTEEHVWTLYWLCINKISSSKR
jgi:hypothetical protein